MAFRRILTLALVALTVSTGWARADNLVIKDANGAVKTTATKTVQGVEHPKHIMEGVNPAGVPTPLAVGDDGALAIKPGTLATDATVEAVRALLAAGINARMIDRFGNAIDFSANQFKGGPAYGSPFTLAATGAATAPIGTSGAGNIQFDTVLTQGTAIWRYESNPSRDNTTWKTAVCDFTTTSAFPAGSQDSSSATRKCPIDGDAPMRVVLTSCVACSLTVSAHLGAAPMLTPNVSPRPTYPDMQTLGAGDSVYNFSSLTSTAVAAATGARMLTGIDLSNANVSDRVCLQFFDLAAGSVVPGTTTAKFHACLPPGSSRSPRVPESGIKFLTAMSVICTTAPANGTAPTTPCSGYLTFR